MAEDSVIQVENLTKRFAGCTAVDGLSFDVKRGEVVGFLGPNGAGKTTTMRILTTFLPATSGMVRVAGYDVLTQSQEIRRRIGYLPESVPLYPEMRVREYLAFRGRLKGLRRARLRERCATVLALCGLEDIQARIIGQLSKGYRQRIGIADCLLHEPEVLILDEPTIGLDPNQIRQARQLIRELGQRHTVLLSTHILSEVEVTCRRVIIIHHGRMVAADTPEKLMRHSLQIVAEIKAPHAEVKAALATLPGVREVVTLDLGQSWWRATLACDAGQDPREALAALVAECAWPLRELHLERQSLETAFMQYTEQERRDA